MTVSPHFDLSRWYLDEDLEMGEGRVQTDIIGILVASLRQLAIERGWSDYVIDSDQFIAWMEDDPQVRVAPDVYLLWNPPADPWVSSWQTWRKDHPTPVFALEVVSYDWRKDYEIGPEKYDDLGVDELIIYDPFPTDRPFRRGTLLQHWRREGDGVFRRQAVDGNAVYSDVFQAHFVAMDSPDGVRVRVARTLEPLDMFPTPSELADEQNARAQVQSRRAEAESRRAEAESRRAEVESRRAEAESQRAEAESQRAEAAMQRAGELLALLKAHGIEPP
jgi:Uma2 family endonuclease